MRRVLHTAIVSAGLAVSCTDTPAEPRLGGLSLQAYAVTAASTDGSPLPSHTGPVDSARIVLTGPTPKTVSVTPPAVVTIDGLQPGSYAAELQAFAGDEIAHQGTVTGIQVTAGRQTSVAEALLAPTRLTFGSLGQTVQLDGPSGVVWSSSDEAVVSVDPSGLVQALTNGRAEITGTLGSATARIETEIAQVVADVAFAAQPGLTAPNRTIAPEVTVELRDALGALVDVPTPVTIAIGDNPSGGTLAGTTTLQAVGGVATFSDLSIDLPGFDYTLTANTDGVPEAASDAFTVAAWEYRRPGDIAVFQNYQPWAALGDSTLQAPPFDFVPDTDYFVRPVAELQGGVPEATSLIFISSASNDSTPIFDFNHADAQSNIDAWVQGGGWLVVHAGDNVLAHGYVVPGMTGIASQVGECTGTTLVEKDHPLAWGPDAVLGTADDLNDDNVDIDDWCDDNHGDLNGILPAEALVLLVAEGSGLPTYATYRWGFGRVTVSTLTWECCFGGPGARGQLLINHYWWAINGPTGAPSPVVAPAVAHPSPMAPMHRASASRTGAGSGS